MNEVMIGREAAIGQVELAGGHELLLTHMALLGAAAILESAGNDAVEVFWYEGHDRPIPVLSAPGLTELVLAHAVREHAKAKADEGSWLHAKANIEAPGKEPTLVSACTPRTRAPSSAEGWKELDRVRLEALDSMNGSLDYRLQVGTGYRSWWVTRNGQVRADLGCSPWEMRTRNKGLEFVGDRLLPLARIVSTWDEGWIADGMCGRTRRDPHGKDSIGSRSSTGFTLPGPTDNATAWCALWGISLFPTLPQLRDGGTSAAWLPRWSEADRSRQLLMAMPTRPLSLARVRAVLRGRDLIAAADTRLTDSERVAAWMRLQMIGIGAVLRFPVEVVGSSSAPERRALAAERVWPQ